MSPQPDKPDPRQLAWGLFLNAHARLVQAIDADLANAKLLSMGWYDILLTLKRAPSGRLRLSSLAERVVLSRSGLTRLVDRLESAGFLRRETAPEDRRGAYAVLLPAGDAALARTWPAYRERIVHHFGRHLTDTEAASLRQLLQRFVPPVADEVSLTISRK